MTTDKATDTTTDTTNRTTEDVARSFSGHQFEDALPHLAEHVEWHLVGQARLTGRDAVVEACRGTAAELADTETTWLRFVSTGPGRVVAVDAVGRYDGPGHEGSGAPTVSAVSSCDVYEFDDADRIVTITSYAVEVDPGTSEPPVARP